MPSCTPKIKSHFFFKTTIRHLLAKVASESGWSHLGFASLVNTCLCILTQ